MYKIPQRQVHLDFHTSGHIKGIGSRFDKEQFKRCLKKGHVNSITVFAKCHHGWSYYPSKVNPVHPELKFDLLGAMLEACREAGVEAPVYLSAGIDEVYTTHHTDMIFRRTRDAKPRTAAVGADGVRYLEDDGGSPRYEGVCLNTPYLEKLCAEVREVVEKYSPIGIFLDIAYPRVCFCDYCKRSVIELGLDESDDESYRIVGERTYKKYTDAIREAATSIKPDVRIFHNGGHIKMGRRDLAYMDTHLELESLPTAQWGYDHFPRSASYVNCLGLEYLGMTGKFHTGWGEFGGYKHPNALKYEVALSLAFGAKCSIGDQMHPYGYLDEATYSLIGQAYAIAEEREPYCYDAERIADIGVLAEEAVGKEKDCLSDTGASRILLEGKYLFDFIDLDCDFSKYKLIILPDNIAVCGRVADKLGEYVRGGGKLLASGASAISDGAFAFDLGARFIGEKESRPFYYRPKYEALGLPSAGYVIYKQAYDVEPLGGEVIGYAQNSFFNRSFERFCSHKHTPSSNIDAAPAVVFGSDGAYIAWKVFTEYATIGSIINKDTVIRVIDRLLGDEKTLVTSLPSAGVVTLNDQRAEHRLVLHALYAVPIKRGESTHVIEDLVPIHNTEFTVRCDREIKRVTLAPEERELPFECEGGVCRFTLPEFTSSQMVALYY